MILAYITRGVGPIEPAVEARAWAMRMGWRWELISGLPLVDAKNRAANIAIEADDSLLMVEDDMSACEVHWRAIDQERNKGGNYNTLVYAWTTCSNGESNVYSDPDGNFIYTGTCFLWIPRYILIKYRHQTYPIFQAASFGYTSDGRELFYKGPNENHTGSDVFFWHNAMKLDPQPTVKSIGHVGHIKHPFNQGMKHNNYYTIECFKLKR